MSLLGSATAAKAQHVEVTLEQRTGDGLDGERKTVTALFADIKDSTELMRDLDPEEARSIIDACIGEARLVVTPETCRTQ
jgi:class 3 adenylate cyclase